MKRLSAIGALPHFALVPGPRAAWFAAVTCAVLLGIPACGKSGGTTDASPGTGTGGATGTGGDTTGGGGEAGSNGGADAGPDVVGPAPPLLDKVTALGPAAGATGTCADTSLRLTFAEPPSIGTAGLIQIWKAGDTSAPADVIDLSAATFDDTIAGRHFYKQRPVVVEGNQAIITPHVGKLVGGASYYVTIGAAVFVDATGASLGQLDDPAGWTFTTVAPAPADPTMLTVAADGTGDFCTVQGAVDFVPAGNTTPTTVTIKSGTYREIVLVSAKHNLTFHGEDRAATVVAYENNDVLQMKGGTKVRALFNVEANDIVLENMTVKNTSSLAGMQAEAIRVDPGDRVILRQDNFLGQQDTMLLTGRVYVADSYIEGNVDFIWGKGAAYFERCELKTVGRAGYVVQARNPTNGTGFIFVDCKLTADPPTLTNNWLARIDISAYPGSQVAYINCAMGPHISPIGWNIGGGSASADLTQLKFWEYESTDLDGAPLAMDMRHYLAKELSATEAATARDKVTAFNGWNPTP